LRQLSRKDSEPVLFRREAQEQAQHAVPRRYCLTEKILAIQVTTDQSQTTLLYVPAGAVISIREGDRPAGDLVSVQWDSQTVLMFRQDIHSRAEHISESLHYTAARGSAGAVH
jgi:hypothetical protein